MPVRWRSPRRPAAAIAAETPSPPAPLPRPFGRGYATHARNGVCALHVRKHARPGTLRLPAGIVFGDEIAIVRAKHSGLNLAVQFARHSLRELTVNGNPARTRSMRPAIAQRWSAFTGFRRQRARRRVQVSDASATRPLFRSSRQGLPCVTPESGPRASRRIIGAGFRRGTSQIRNAERTRHHRTARLDRRCEWVLEVPYGRRRRGRFGTGTHRGRNPRFSLPSLRDRFRNIIRP